MKSFFTGITCDENYSLVLSDLIGTHSIRKLLATYVTRNGCSKNEVDAKGRGNLNIRISDSYIDCVNLCPCAKVAGFYSKYRRPCKLCGKK